jgi:RNA polymerase sigma-70 factor (ECF subfamily)
VPTTMMATMSQVPDRPPGRARRVSRDADRDAHAFDELFRELAPALYRALYAYTGRNRAIAEEATAEAFARALAYRSGIRDPRAWLYRTAFRIATVELRERRAFDAEMPDLAVDPPELIDVASALRELTPNQRAVVVLRYVADLSTREVAYALGMSTATVRVHVFRARARLRLLLADEED